MKFPSTEALYSIFSQHPAISTDSRKIAPGSLFFALKGEAFDGNRFAEAAVQQGAAYSVVDDEQFYSGERCILVKDGLAALQDLAAHHRRQFNIPFIGITGSNGKTTTKELIKAVLARKYKVHATEGNLNNHIGVPLTLLSITPAVEIAIIEMGANHVGEIAALCEIARPDYGLITNIGRAHIGEFGSFEKIVEAKSELYKYIRSHNGKVFIYSEHEMLMSLSAGIEKITYGTAENNFCSSLFQGSNPFLKIGFDAESITTQLIGKYNYENAAAAICIGKYFQVGAVQIKEAIEGYVPSNNRSQVVMTQLNTLVMDAYNANPSSMRAAIDNFYDMEGESKWLVLGDMLELGAYEIDEHKNILQLLIAKNFNNVILVGPRFIQSSLEVKNDFVHFKTTEELIDFLRTKKPVRDKSLILIKGSRGIKLEKAAEFL
jgi:UDP-N-acetylmuramoyl-tripeptide--D-alanyl-D-alanine ligase